MQYFKSITCIFTSFLLMAVIHAQPGSQLAARRPWNAQWIAAANDDGMQYGVYYFRKNISLGIKPKAFKIYVSADNRYKLFVNDVLVSLGPARGDTYFWNYETVDIASYLNAGINIVGALVWNEAQYRPEAQISVRTGFIVQGSTAAEEILNTDNSWKCIRDKGHQPIPRYFFAASKGEMINMNQAIKSDWTAGNFSDSDWPKAAKVMDGKLKGMAWGIDWALVPSNLPAREMTYQRLQKLRSTTGINVPSTFPEKKNSFTVPANTTATLLLDQSFETNAYVTLNFSGGKDAGISLGYAESLYEDSKGERKNNRNETEGKTFVGRIDSIIADGSQAQSYTTLNFRRSVTSG